MLSLLVSLLLPSAFAWSPPEPVIPTDVFRYECTVEFSEQVGSQFDQATQKFSVTNESLHNGSRYLTTQEDGWTVGETGKLPKSRAGHEISFDFGYTGVPRAKDRAFLWVRINRNEMNASAQSFARYSTHETVETSPSIYTRADSTSLTLNVSCERIK